MSGLARWFKEDGYQVSGCDQRDGAVLTELRLAGIDAHTGHHPEHLRGVDQLISSMAIPDDHPEMAAARRQGIPTRKRIELLGDIFELRQAIAVTGTHGKSTTSGMIAALALAVADDPSVQLGASLPAIGGNMRYGRGPQLIAEVDESDPGFAELASTIAILTNLEDDHIAGDYPERRNYHATLADLEQATRSFARRAQAVLYCADWPLLTQLLGDLEHTSSYGFSPDATYRIHGLQLEAHGSRFYLHTPTGKYRVELTIPGRHNVQNAAAALAAAALAGYPLERCLEVLARFSGVGRRWQLWGEIENALIIDDYAHHPTEVAATLQTAKHTGRRVRAVLQPHRWIRTARHWPALADSVAQADEVLVLDIYSAGEQAIPGISVDLIIERLKASGRQVSHHSHASATAYLAATLQPNDLIITLGAGDVWRVAAELVQSNKGRSNDASRR